MADNRPIGVFDSGVGGLSVLKILKKELPSENFIYFGDTARIPYGEKTSEQLIIYAREILDWYKSIDVKMTLMACNSSSATSLDTVKPYYDYEIMGLISPTARFIANSCFKRIGIMATSATIKSQAYKKNIIKHNSNIEVFQMPCPGLVEIVENGLISTSQAIETVKSFLIPLINNNVDKIVLGCTHYPYLTDLINQITMKDDLLINPAEYLVNEAKNYLKSNNMLSVQTVGDTKYYVSSNPEKFNQTGKIFLKEDINAQILYL